MIHRRSHAVHPKRWLTAATTRRTGVDAGVRHATHYDTMNAASPNLLTLLHWATRLAAGQRLRRVGSVVRGVAGSGRQVGTNHASSRTARRRRGCRGRRCSLCGRTGNVCRWAVGTGGGGADGTAAVGIAGAIGRSAEQRAICEAVRRTRKRRRTSSSGCWRLSRSGSMVMLAPSRCCIGWRRPRRRCCR